MYFGNCKTVEELKALYKQLCRENHPDMGGSLEKMQAINAEYDKAFERLKNIHTTADGKKYEKQSNEAPKQFREIIEKLIRFDITIDLVGSWIWVTGDTFTAKETLKELGFKWASKKKAWYWTAEPSGKRSRMTLEQIKDKYGCESFKGNKQILIS